MGFWEKLKEYIEEIQKDAREVLRVDYEKSHLVEKYQDRELRIEIKAELEINLFVIAVKLQKAWEWVFKYIIKNEKNENNRKRFRSRTVPKSSDHSSKKNLENNKQ